MADNDTTEFYDAIAEFYPLFYKDWDVQLEREGLSLRLLWIDIPRSSVSLIGAGRHVYSSGANGMGAGGRGRPN